MKVMPEKAVSSQKNFESKNSNRISFKQKVLNLDTFAENFTIKFDQGKSNFPTLIGSILSILMFALTITYTVQKTEIMFNKKGIDVITAEKTNYFPTDYKFGAE